MSGKVINKGNNNKNIEAGRDVNIFNSYSDIHINHFVEVISKIGQSVSMNSKELITEPPDIKSKINFNNLFDIEPVIKSHALYVNVIEQAKNCLEKNTDTALYWCNTTNIIISKYYEIKNQYKNSSSVDIWYKTKNSILEYNKINDSMLSNVLELLMVHLFIKCKIFEEPVQ